MDKNRIVDTLFFGTFAPAALLNNGVSNYAYCPGPKAVLKLIENEDNIAEID